MSYQKQENKTTTLRAGRIQLLNSHPKNYPNNPAEQAKDIWEHPCTYISRGQKAALIYAANNTQAKSIISAYSDTKVDDKIIGAGQAKVFGEIQNLSKRKKNQFHILPMSTSLCGLVNKPGNIVTLKQIDRDLTNIAGHIGAGAAVYALWVPGKGEQLSLETPLSEAQGHFSIGGKNSPYWRTTKHVYIIESSPGIYTQHNTADLSGARVPNNAMSQGAYADKMLCIMVDKKIEEWPKFLYDAFLGGQKQSPYGSSKPHNPSSHWINPRHDANTTVQGRDRNKISTPLLVEQADTNTHRCCNIL